MYQFLMISSDTESLPNELMDMIDGIGFSSESELDLFDNKKSIKIKFDFSKISRVIPVPV